MNFKKLGWYLVALGVILGVASAVFAWLPYDMRWEHFRAIAAATSRGETSDLYRIERQFEAYGQFKVGFGIAAAITIFLGAAVIASAKPPSSRKDGTSDSDTWTCSTCQVSNPSGHGCKLCGEMQKSTEGS